MIIEYYQWYCPRKHPQMIEATVCGDYKSASECNLFVLCAECDDTYLFNDGVLGAKIAEQYPFGNLLG